MTKASFIEILMSMTDKELAQYIKDHGKPAKLIDLIRFTK